jgi:subtilisin family serine protease
MPFYFLVSRGICKEKMSDRVMRDLFHEFGVAAYHARGIRGQGVSMMVIDTGCGKGHGLAVSSIISDGIAPDASIDLADVIDPSSIPIDSVIDAIKRGVDLDVDIISISLGTEDAFGPMQDVLREAHDKGILVFAAAGNSGERGYEFPAAYDRVISVASINSARQPSLFNTRNDAVAVFAPGENIRLALSPEAFSGTSFATPFAAGLAALVLSERRSAEPRKVPIRLSRKEMVATLRNQDHLDLNCEDHTFAVDGPSCFGGGPPRSAKAKESSIQVPIAFAMLILLLCAGAWLIRNS